MRVGISTWVFAVLAATALFGVANQPAVAASDRHRPNVISVGASPKFDFTHESRWIAVAARDRNGTVVSVRLRFGNGIELTADGNCRTAKSNRARSDGRRVTMHIPVPESVGASFRVRALAESVRCNRSKTKKRPELQRGKWRSFEVALPPAPTS